MVHLFSVSKKSISLSVRNGRLLVFYSPAFAGCRWFISDVSGKELFSGEVSTSVLKDIELSSDMRSGIYELRIIDGDQLLGGRFRVES
jgi:hypothetical protein